MEKVILVVLGLTSLLFGKGIIRSRAATSGIQLTDLQFRRAVFASRVLGVLCLILFINLCAR
ncbi:MAG: hypothetical protein LLG24_02190 [Actinomycetia bacterium]|nr:hypothetical protein [Actinomycetes bacterium]